MSELLEQTPAPQNCGHALDYRCANCDPEWIESPTTLIGSDTDTQREPVQPDIEALIGTWNQPGFSERLKRAYRAQQDTIDRLQRLYRPDPYIWVGHHDTGEDRCFWCYQPKGDDYLPETYLSHIPGCAWDALSGSEDSAPPG